MILANIDILMLDYSKGFTFINCHKEKELISLRNHYQQISAFYIYVGFIELENLMAEILLARNVKKKKQFTDIQSLIDFQTCIN